MHIEQHILAYLNLDKTIEQLKIQAKNNYQAAVADIMDIIFLLHEVWEENLPQTRQKIDAAFDNTTSQNLVEGFIVQNLPLWPHDVSPKVFFENQEVNTRVNVTENLTIIFELTGGHYVFELPIKVLTLLDAAHNEKDKKQVLNAYIDSVLTQSIEYSQSMGL